VISSSSAVSSTVLVICVSNPSGLVSDKTLLTGLTHQLPGRLQIRAGGSPRSTRVRDVRAEECPQAATQHRSFPSGSLLTSGWNVQINGLSVRYGGE